MAALSATVMLKRAPAPPFPMELPAMSMAEPPPPPCSKKVAAQPPGGGQYVVPLTRGVLVTPVGSTLAHRGEGMALGAWLLLGGAVAVTAQAMDRCTLPASPGVPDAPPAAPAIPATFAAPPPHQVLPPPPGSPRVFPPKQPPPPP